MNGMQGTYTNGAIFFERQKQRLSNHLHVNRWEPVGNNKGWIL